MIFVIKKHRIKLALVCIICMLTLIISVNNPKVKSVFTASAKADWGLGYTENGKTPTGNRDSTYLKQYNACYVGDENEKNIYLTFDAGYENGATEQILDALKKHNARACFFLVGNYIKTRPDLVKRMVEEGHIVGNHTMSHPDMSKISDLEDFRKELSGLEDLYREVTGQEMQKFYRPPQGKFNEENLKQAQQLGYKTFFWSLAYVDWLEAKQPTKEEAFSKLIPRIHPGAVVLLHSTSKTNGAILDELLTEWEKLGYTFKGIDEISV